MVPLVMRNCPGTAPDLDIPTTMLVCWDKILLLEGSVGFSLNIILPPTGDEWQGFANGSRLLIGLMNGQGGNRKYKYTIKYNIQLQMYEVLTGHWSGISIILHTYLFPTCQFTGMF